MPSLINRMPHTLTIVTSDDQEPLRISQGGPPARLCLSETETDPIIQDGQKIPVWEAHADSVKHLPEPQEDVYVVVSRAVALAQRDRTDLLVPQGLIINEERRVKGCSGLIRYVF